MQEPSDESLMASVARGDRQAFRDLADRYAARAVGLARRLTGSEADAEEIAQEALLRVWTHAPRWRPLAAFRTWFYRIVLNLCFSRRRRPAMLGLEEAGEVVDPAPDPAAVLEREETDRRLADAIGTLPERQRAAVLLTYREGMSNVEVATVLESTVSAVETLLVRARRSLRETLEQERRPRDKE